MPFYEYRCPHCNHRFEELVDFDESDPECPKCGGTTSRLLSTPSFSLKGDGWYSDHYGLKGPTDSKSTKQSSESNEDKD